MKRKVSLRKKTNKRLAFEKKSWKLFWVSLFTGFAVIVLITVAISPVGNTQVLGASTSKQHMFNLRLCNSWTGGKCQRSCNSSTQVRSSDHCLWPTASGVCCYPKRKPTPTPKLPKGFPAGGAGYPTPRYRIF